jgi:hypothetical protein
MRLVFGEKTSKDDIYVTLVGIFVFIRLYYKLHKTNRPIELRNSVIRRRRRSIALRQNYMLQEEPPLNHLASLPSLRSFLTEPRPRLSRSLPSLHIPQPLSIPSPLASSVHSLDMLSPMSEQTFHYSRRNSCSMDLDFDEPLRFESRNLMIPEKENHLLSFANIVSNQQKTPTTNPMSLSEMML